MPRKNQTPKHQPYIDTDTCQTKRRFANKRQAEAAIAMQELQNNLVLLTYKCVRCSGWHLTGQKLAI